MSEMAFCTPKKLNNKLMQKIQIPPSPFMKKIGFGTGVAVYELERSPAYNKFRSPWAIKKLIKRKKNNSTIQNRLKTEADILRKLVHPNVVGFRAFLERNDGYDVLAMEECSSSLGDLIETRGDNGEGPFSPKILMKVTLDIAHALSYLHNNALIMHCDVKSYNVLIKGDFDICKLCDFGTYLPVLKNGEVDKEKAPGAEYVGTQSWSAPEVLKYPQEITTKADIYSLGLVIWEMIALGPPVTEDMAGWIKSCSFMDEDELDTLMTKMGSRNRPSLPTDIELGMIHPMCDMTAHRRKYLENNKYDLFAGDDYKAMLEIYCCCTEIDRNHRPPAMDLIVILDEIMKNIL